MSYTKETTIWCDNVDLDGHYCSQWEQHSDSVNNVRKALKRLGWTTVRINGEIKDYCPICSAKRNWGV